MMLHRTSSDENGTYGELRFGREWVYTVEPPWKNNEPFVSCVPDGFYKVFPHNSPRFGETYILENRGLGVGLYEGWEVEFDGPEDGRVRWGILIHVANAPSQLAGCIAPGLDRGTIVIDGRPQKGVTSSRAAMDKLIRSLGRKDNRCLVIRSTSHD